MRVVLSAAGRFHVFHLAHQLAKKQALEHLYTASWEERDAQKISSNLIINNLLLQWGEWLYEKSHLNRFFRPSDYYVVKDNYFDRWVARQLKGPIDIFTVWAHYGLASISLAKTYGAKVVLECGSMHILEQEKLLMEEYERWGLSFSPMNPANREKVLKEYREADYIAVPALHVEKSFFEHGISSKKILKNSYGTDLSCFKSKKNRQQKKWTALFVGTINLNKGVPYLLEAWEKAQLPFHNAELVLIGNIQPDIQASYFKNYQKPSNVSFIGTLSQQDLAKKYQEADLLVLPSLQEGIAMVQVEAMASGVPVLGTVNAGSEELFTSGDEGFIVPIRNSEALAEKLVWGYEHQDELFEMGQRAAQKAQNYSWDAYGDRIFEAYKKILAE